MSGFSGKIRIRDGFSLQQLVPHTRGGLNREAEVFQRGGLALILDGEVYGSLRQANGLADPGQAYHLASLYDRKGLDFLKGVRGAFSLVLADADSQRVVLAVDPFATRPLYYRVNQETLVFGSRISYFTLYPEVSLEIDPNAIHYYLNHSFIPAPYSVCRQIHRLQPGQLAVWEKGTLSVRQYWDLSYDEDPALEEEKAAALVREKLEDSVRIRLQNGAARNGQVGAFLSGGTDSSTVVGLMTGVTGRRVKVFSVGFEEKPYNEIWYARVAARHFGCEAFEYLARPKDILEIVSLLAQEYDEPFGNSSALPTYCCLRMARDAGVEVMFAGDGGDELFAGNERYLTEKILSLYQVLPDRARRWLDPLAEQLPPVYPLGKVRSYVRKSNQPNPERFLTYQLYVRHRAAEFFTEDFQALLDLDFPLQVAREHYERVQTASELNRLLYLDMKTAIADNDLFKVNRMAESLGLGVRYPFLDPEVAAVAGQIPARLKIKGGRKRYIFKEAFRRLLPREILRKKKHGFGLPTGQWLRNDPGFKDLARSLLLDARAVQRGYFKRAALEDLLRRHEQEKNNYYGSIIWNFMMLELWHRRHADTRAVSVLRK
jgi:asparagine synthase (glutamine-hydrolysing)